MVNKLVTRAVFARLAGVTPAAVTKAAAKGLRPAVSGKRIDAGHPVAVAYLEKQTAVPTPTLPGIDPLYERAVELCLDAGRCSATYLRGALGIGQARARVLAALINSTGAVAAAATTRAKAARPPIVPSKVASNARTERERKKKNAPAPPAAEVVPTYIEAFLDMTLGDLVRRFGTDTHFLDWLRATQVIESIQEKRIKNAQLTGELIQRRLVHVGVIEPLDTLFKKLLTDGVRTMATRAATVAAAGGSVDEVETFLKDQIISFIKPAKAAMKRALKNADA